MGIWIGPCKKFVKVWEKTGCGNVKLRFVVFTFQNGRSTRKKKYVICTVCYTGYLLLWQLLFITSWCNCALCVGGGPSGLRLYIKRADWKWQQIAVRITSRYRSECVLYCVLLYCVLLCCILLCCVLLCCVLLYCVLLKVQKCCATNRKVAGSIPTSVSVAFPSYCAEDNFWSKWRFVWQSVSLKDSHINVMDCTFHFLSHDQLHVVFSWPSAFDCVSVTVIEGHGHLTQNDKLITSDTVYRKVL